jgi:hypothetical protein
MKAGGGESLKPVSYVSLFRYANAQELTLVILGCIASVINGGALPGFSVLFGSCWCFSLLLVSSAPTDCLGQGSMQSLVAPALSFSRSSLSVCCLSSEKLTCLWRGTVGLFIFEIARADCTSTVHVCNAVRLVCRSHRIPPPTSFSWPVTCKCRHASE